MIQVFISRVSKVRKQRFFCHRQWKWYSKSSASFSSYRPNNLWCQAGATRLGYMATHSSILSWRIPWTEEPGKAQFMVSQELDMTEPLNHHHNSNNKGWDDRGRLWQIFLRADMARQRACCLWLCLRITVYSAGHQMPSSTCTFQMVKVREKVISPKATLWGDRTKQGETFIQFLI